jgi:PIN domain nuclease of toxin-antitoxin system
MHLVWAPAQWTGAWTVGTRQRALALRWEHRDPADTMIVATAQKYSACIVTADALIRSFYNNTIC